MTTESQITIEPRTDAGLQMAGVVKEAWLATSQLGDDVAPETREVAFKLVLEAMLRNGGSTPPGAEAPDDGSSDSHFDNTAEDDLYSTPELRMDAVSAYLEIEGEEVEILFAVEDAVPRLQVSPTKLARTKSKATREIALLVLGARTALGLDTQMNDVREYVDHYKKYDAANFAKTLQTSPELVVLGKPRSSQRTVRLRSKGVEAARELAKRLVAE